MDEPSADPVERRDAMRLESLVAGVAAALGALVLGLIRSGRSFGYDEGYSYVFFIRGGSIERALTTQIVFNNHPMFSAIQSLAWRGGLVGERAQRLGPVLCGALAVGIVAWMVARRGGAVAGVGAGVVLAMNPIFLEQFRQLRGYALATVAVLIAGVALWRSWSDERLRWLVVQALCMVVAVTTHAYSALTIALVAIATFALGRGRPRHIVTWAVAACVALAIMSPLVDDMRANASSRGNRFAPDFPVFLLRSLGGSTWPAVAITAILMVLGAVAIGRRSARYAVALAMPTVALGGVFFVVWFVVRPFDLYVRFFVSIVPLVALLAGWGLAQLPRVAQIAVVVALATALAPGVADILDTEPGIRDAATIVDRARAAGFEVCGGNAEPLSVYTSDLALTSPSIGFAGCEVYVSVLGLGADGRAITLERFGGRFDVGDGVIVWASPATLAQITTDQITPSR